MKESKIDIEELYKIDGFSWKIQLALLDLLCRCIEPTNVVELGTWHGRSAVIFSSYVNDKNGLFWGVEPEPTRAEITKANCERVCPNGKIIVERNISNYSQLNTKVIPFVDIVHIDGEHSFTAVYHDLELVKKFLLKEGLIILDDFYFDMYPQITQAAYKWLEDNPEFVLLAVGFCKGVICNRMSYRKYADMILSSEFMEELKKYDTGVEYLTVTRTSPLMDCQTLGICTNVSKASQIGNESGDGRLERVCT